MHQHHRIDQTTNTQVNILKTLHRVTFYMRSINQESTNSPFKSSSKTLYDNLFTQYSLHCILFSFPRKHLTIAYILFLSSFSYSLIPFNLPSVIQPSICPSFYPFICPFNLPLVLSTIYLSFQPFTCPVNLPLVPSTFHLSFQSFIRPFNLPLVPSTFHLSLQPSIWPYNLPLVLSTFHLSL